MKKLLFFFFLIQLSSVHGQHKQDEVPDFTKIKWSSLYMEDSLAITNLVLNGTKVVNGRTVCWFPKDSLSSNRMTAIAKLIDRGITLAEDFIHTPADWQAYPNGTYTFYFRPGKFISHASLCGFISIPLWRIKSDQSPWLHEAFHEMLNHKSGAWPTNKDTVEWANNVPIWLLEGLPEYFANEVSSANNIPKFDPFTKSYRTNADSLFLIDLRTDKGKLALTNIGTKGVGPNRSNFQLLSDRKSYAPAFYHGSASFLKYISDTYGIDVLLKTIASFKGEHETIEKLTGKSISELKDGWIREIENHKK
jgi:hypothetical protein